MFIKVKFCMSMSPEFEVVSLDKGQVMFLDESNAFEAECRD